MREGGEVRMIQGVHLCSWWTVMLVTSHDLSLSLAHHALFTNRHAPPQTLGALSAFMEVAHSSQVKHTFLREAFLDLAM